MMLQLPRCRTPNIPPRDQVDVEISVGSTPGGKDPKAFCAWICID